MRIVKDRMNIDFQIKAGNRYVTVASLVPWFISKHSCKYNCIFSIMEKNMQKVHMLVVTLMVM